MIITVYFYKGIKQHIKNQEQYIFSFEKNAPLNIVFIKFLSNFY